MRKYVTVPDIRAYPSYRSINARLLYIHCAMGMDVESRNYTHSWRQLSAELGIPLQQIRTALKMLEKDGLIATQQVTQKVTYGLTQQVTHKVTQMHILSVSEIDEASNEASNSPSNSQSNSQNNSQNNSDINNKNNKKNISHAVTDARVNDEDLIRLAANEFSISGADASALLEKFYRRQALKDKKWAGDGDKTAHFIAWCEKNMPRKPAPRKTDNQAREAEYSRAAEQEAEKTDQEKAFEEITRLKRWITEDRKQLKQSQDEEGKAKLKDLIRQLTEEYNRKVDEYNNKYNGKEAS